MILSINLNTICMGLRTAVLGNSKVLIEHNLTKNDSLITVGFNELIDFGLRRFLNAW